MPPNTARKRISSYIVLLRSRPTTRETVPPLSLPQSKKSQNVLPCKCVCSVAHIFLRRRRRRHRLRQIRRRLVTVTPHQVLNYTY